MEYRAGGMADAAAVRHQARHHAARAIKAGGIAVGMHRLLGPGVAVALAWEVLVDPAAIEEFHEWKIEDVGPYDRGRAVIAVVVPGAVRGQDQIASCRSAALALDRRV